MKKYIKILTITFLIIFVLVNTLFLYPKNSISAETPEEIQKRIDEQNAKLNETKNDIKSLENQINEGKNYINSQSDGIPKLTAELQSVEKELELNTKQLQLLKEENLLKEAIKQKLIVEQAGALNSTYKQWRIKKDNFVTSINLDNPRMNNMGTFFSSKVLGLSNDDINFVAQEITKLNSEIEASENTVGSLNQKKKDLENKRIEIENAIAYYNSLIFVNSGSIAQLQENALKIENVISTLTQAQKEALLEQARLAQQNGGGGQSVAGCRISDDNNWDNNIYICGIGNDFHQGHGVGLSQWGAYGMSQSGFSAQNILKFYYTGVEISGGYEGRSVNVAGYGSVNIEDYVAGQGEVPAKACGNAQQAAENPSKYVNDNPNTIWDCWPEEVIKAQAIAFRTYGIYNSGFVYTDARSQVYNGTKTSNWAAEETRGQIITFGGQPIEALYSADNNQGFGTANNDTMFQNYAGDGTAYGYLRSANDTPYAVPMPGPYNRNWGYKTSSYTMDNINQMIDYAASNSNRFGGFSGFVASLKSQLGGKVVNLTFERDPSLRVKKVFFKSVNGNTAVMGGWWFTYMWNLYTNDYNIRNANGSVDWLWSQTFFLHIN